MCRVTDICMCIKVLSDRKLYSLKTINEICDTFPRQDAEGIRDTYRTGEFYVKGNLSGSEMYKICSSDEELTEFLRAAGEKGNIFANNAREPLSYASLLIKNFKRLITYCEPNGGTV